jgi:large subunit ribosomal protein L21
MYAVIKAGGKQHKVKAGDVIEIEVTHGAADEAVTFTPLLVVDDDGKAHFGKELGRAVVKAKLVGEHKGDKLKVFKYRPKTGYAKRQGHRQTYTLVEIQDVSLGRAPAKKAGAKESAKQPSKRATSPAEPGVDEAEAAEPAES